jgi:hypothetical protein
VKARRDMQYFSAQSSAWHKQVRTLQTYSLHSWLSTRMLLVPAELPACCHVGYTLSLLLLVLTWWRCCCCCC